MHSKKEVSRLRQFMKQLQLASFSVAVLLAVPGISGIAAAQEATASSSETTVSGEMQNTEIICWTIAFIASIIALVFALQFYRAMMKTDEGTPTMIEIAGHVREGAAAYLKQQYKIVFCFFVIIFLLLAFASYVMKVQSGLVPFAFLTGGFFSGLAGFFGMKTATWASSRTAAGAEKSLNAGLQVAFRSGAVMGLTVVGLGLLDITIWYAILRWYFDVSLIEITVTMLCFGMGASSQALFARVGGGIFTKAADVGADLVGKVEQGIPEDDPRNPATIADNVGDNVGDVAGMGADLYESYCGSILATAALGVAAFAGGDLLVSNGIVDSLVAAEAQIEDFQLRALFLPMTIAAVGILLSILGIFLVRTQEDASQKALLKALGRGIDASTILVVLVSVLLTWWLLPQFLGVSGSVIIGLAAGWLIGKWTEFQTSDEYQPTKDLAEQCVTGPATVIIAGVAGGMKSVWVPVIVVCLATLGAFAAATKGNFVDVEYFALGLYGVGIAAVGMLSTLGITLATDAYGPIADNAGGNAEMSGLDPIVRERTDALDSLGNTTAATGKGFAIGSAALTALALLAAYIEEVRIGFERWGADEAVVAQDGTDEWYKVNDQMIVQRSTPAEGELANHTWLIFPEDARHSAWRQHNDAGIQVTGASTPLDDKVSILGDSDRKRSMTINGDESGESLTLISVKHATLPDFAHYYDASLMNPKVLVGVFVGCMATFVFCAMTMEAVGRAAKGMVEEVRRQFQGDAGIMAGTSKPDYAAPVLISTQAAQREMITPSLLGLITPIATGLLLGVGGVLGLLVGTLTCGFCVAIFMANSGGSWDNAKKYIEAGNFGGKGSDSHKAGVVGDTVGDPFKDTSGPSLNILIKLMSMVSVVVAGLVVRYSLLAMGIF